MTSLVPRPVPSTHSTTRPAPHPAADPTGPRSSLPRALSALYALLVGRRAKWAVLALAVVLSGLVLAGRGSAPASSDPTAGLPAAAESVRVAALQRQLPTGQVNPALVVYARAGAPLTDADEAAITADAARFAPLASGGRVPPAEFAPDRRAALVLVPVAADLPGARVVEVVDRLRAEARDGLPAGVSAQVTGGAGFTADISRQFQGADVSLLLVTVAVVAVLLLITYRSPVLWLLPLLVIGLGEQVAAGLVSRLDRATGLGVDPATGGIVSVLVFGAGTNYALLLIARYREELRAAADRHAAMRAALRAAAPAALASATTVALSLLTLLAALSPANRALGVAGAVGIVTALVFALAVLPAALVVFGRWLFWPLVPRVGQPDPTRTGPWSRVAAAVARRPRAVTTGSVAVLAAASAGLLGAELGLSQTEQFRTRVEAVEGLDTLARSFPAGAAAPTVVLVPAAVAEQVARAAAATPGVARAEVTGRGAPAALETDAGGLAQVAAVLDAAPGTPAALETVRALRAALDSVTPEALVGGPIAAELDRRDGAARDARVVAPLVLGVVFVVLALLLRSLVAPVLLVATVVASYAAALGAANLLFTRVLDFPAIDVGVPLLSFLFLVALGVDYNIFLTTRAREEAHALGTRAGVRTALAVTGGVITSAGILLAAVFAVLGVLPLITLTQLGIIVGLGVLLDTLLVRSVLVPALVLDLDRRFWWPSSLARATSPTRRASRPT